MTTVRICKEEEVNSLGEMIIPSWHKECFMQDFGMVLDTQEMLEEFRKMVNSPDADTILLLDNDIIVGVLGMIIYKSPVGKEKIAGEHFWYVLHSYRGWGSIRMFKYAKQWAKEKGCSMLIFNASKMASDLHDNVCKLYDRLGMKHFETVYIQDIREV